MAITRSAFAAACDEARRLRRASALLARGAMLGRRRSSRLAAARRVGACAVRVARFNRKLAKYNFCQLIGEITPVRCLEKMLSLARGDLNLVAADPTFRAGLHQSVRVQRLLTPGEVDGVNRRWRAVKRGMRRSPAFSY